MRELRTFINSLPADQRDAFAGRCQTSIGYLRKAISRNERLREALCIAIERESAGAVRVETLRPDVDWRYLRGTAAANDGAQGGGQAAAA